MHTLSIKVPVSPLTKEESEFLLSTQDRYFEKLLTNEKDFENGLISEEESKYVCEFNLSELSKVNECFLKIKNTETTGFCKLSSNQLAILSQAIVLLKDLEAKAKVCGDFDEQKKVKVSTFFEIMIGIAVSAI